MKLLYNIKKVIFLIFVLYFLFYLSFDFVSPNLTVKYLGYKPYVVLTDSMEPAIKAGFLVIATYKKKILYKKMILLLLFRMLVMCFLFCVQFMAL